MRRPLAIAGLAAAAGLVAWAVLDLRVAAGGWLIGFVFWTGPVLGALLLGLVGRLTGGPWRAAVAPLAAAAPVLLFLFAPLAAGRGAVYAWAGQGTPPEPAGLWLSPALFVLRGAVALAVWAGVSMMLARGRGGRLGPALGLLAHGLFLGLVGLDWITALRPGWVSSNLAMSLAAQQVAAAAALAGLLGLGGGDARAARDLAGLLAAGVLGTAYLAFMDYLVVWYGDLPAKIPWYLVRTQAWWWTLAPASLAVGAAAPLVILAAGRAPWPERLRLAAGPALLGLLLYQLFMIAPPFGAGVLVPALLALVAQAAALAEGGRRLATASEEVAHA
jgi:hypothetical protein